MCLTIKDWQNLIQVAITALAGLLGVGVGGWMAGRHQREERKNARIREQLMDFYAPLRGMRSQIRAKSELRVKIHSAAQGLWSAKFEGAGAETQQKIDEEQSPKYEKIWDYSDEQLKGDLVPLYQRMLEHFTAHMGLAEPSTLAYYSQFVEFVELWNRFLKGALPAEVADRLDHTEEKLKPLYQDIEENFARFSAQLK
jgi:hypothetical protein